MFFILILYALFASVFTISKVALTAASPFFLIGSRMCVAGLLMLGYQWFKEPGSLTLKKGAYLRIVLLAFFNIYLTNVCEYWGLQYLTSFKTCFIYSLSPFLSALLCYFVFSEQLTQKKWMGLLIGFVGFIPILVAQGAEEALSGEFWLFSWAELAVIAAAISSVYGWIVLGQLIKQDQLSPLTANSFSMLLGGFLALVHSYFFEEWSPVPVSDYSTFITLALLLIVVSNLSAYNLYGHLLKSFSATFLSFAGFTTPLFTVLFGWLTLGEVATLPFYISAVVVFIGLFLFYQEELKKEPVYSQSS